MLGDCYTNVPETTIRKLIVYAHQRAAECLAEEELSWPGDTQYNGGDEEAQAMQLKTRAQDWQQFAEILGHVLCEVL